MNTKEKNYRVLVNKAEKAFSNGRYLEAFLIQSCIFESVIKDYAHQFLKSIFDSHPVLKKKSNNFELARMVDELFIAGKINSKLYENLNNYRKKRNLVIHKILYFKKVKHFDKELRDTYKSGLNMKIFIVEQMVKGKKGETSSVIAAKLERALAEIIPEFHKAADRELKPLLRKLNKDITKFSDKKG